MTQRNFVITNDNKSADMPGVMLATIVALKDLGSSGTTQEIYAQVIKNENISEEEQAYLTPKHNEPKLPNYLSFARTHLKFGGALESPQRGLFVLTNECVPVLTLDDAKLVYKKSNEILNQRSKERSEKKKLEAKSIDNDTGQSVSDELSDDIDPDNEDWKDTLLNTLQSMEGYAFERLCQLLLRKAGFIEVNVNPKKGADGGIDGVGILRVNLVSFKVYFQCKCWTGSPVGSKEIRNFRGALDASVDKALFITTSTFTSSAREEAIVKGKTVIDLIDGDRLCDLLKENNLGVQTEMVEQVNITPEWFDRFNTK